MVTEQGIEVKEFLVVDRFEETFPQRLKPPWFSGACGTAQGRALSKRIGTVPLANFRNG
jgi:hypothetical protein